ncbi:MAG: translocation/assembly module TamB domain-containing protein [Deltaproteobacteria bacterium]|nr:translocation/assembly module TamB domain-containing protein [Deltaproteobacteria bacterium]
MSEKAKSTPAPARRRRLRLYSVVLLALLVTLGYGLQSRWLGDRVAERLALELRKATRMEVHLGRPVVSYTTGRVRIDDITLGPPSRPLVWIGSLEVAPNLGALFRGEVNLQQVTADRARVYLQLGAGPDGALVLRNGPPPAREPSTPGPAPSLTALDALPFRDIAIGDVQLRVEHDTLGSVDLGPVDLDIVHRTGTPFQFGLLVPGGAVRYRGETHRVERLEARVAVDLREQTVRVATARVHFDRSTLDVFNALYDFDRQRLTGVDLQVYAPLLEALALVPGAPRFEGEARARVRGASADFVTGRFHVPAVVDGNGLALDIPGDRGETWRYATGDAVHAVVDATPERILVTDFRAAYGNADVRSEALTVTLGERPTLDGVADIAHLDFTRLMKDTAVTPRTKILWTLSGRARLHGTLSPFHLEVGLEGLDTTNFAVLRDFYTISPQRPLVHIPRATLTGRMVFTDETLTFEGMEARFGASLATVDRIRVRLAHAASDPDLVIENLRSEGLQLGDLGRVADLPIGGHVTELRANLCGHFDDPPMDGTLKVDDFSLSGFPFGHLETARGTVWHYQDLRVDLRATDRLTFYPLCQSFWRQHVQRNTPPPQGFPLAELTGRFRQSDYRLRDAFLDFRGRMNDMDAATWRHLTPENASRTYAMLTGARVQSDRLKLHDFYAMFHFENDPTFTPFDGAGRADVKVNYVLGRPGDDRDGVMAVNTALDRWDLTAFDERLDHAEALVDFTWLRRRDGARGARTSVRRFEACKGGDPPRDPTAPCGDRGRLRFSGSMDVGGQVHFVAEAARVPLQGFDGIQRARAPVAGTVTALAAIEGTPDAPRVTGDLTLQGLTAVGRNLGTVDLHLTQSPLGAPAPTFEARPPDGRLDLTLRALDDRLRVQARLVTPWSQSHWREPSGLEHTSWERAWGASVLSADARLAEALDILPWLPPSVLARLSPDAEARARLALRVDSARLDDFLHADARVRVDELQARDQGVGLSLARGSSLALCIHGGYFWLVPPQELGEGMPDCATVPHYLSPNPAVTAHTNPFDLAHPQFLGPEGTELWVTGGGQTTGTFTGTLRGEVDLERLAALTPRVTWARGTGTLEVTAAGSRESVDLGGNFTLHDGALGLADVPFPVNDLDLVVRFQGSEARLEEARASLGPGVVDLTGGFLRLQGTHLERVDVPLVVRSLTYAPQEGVDLGLEADTHLRWAAGDELPVFSGDVTVTRGRYARPIALSLDLSGRLRGPAAPQSQVRYDPANDRVRLDLRVATRAPLRVVNNLADIDLRLTDERPFRVLGTDQRVGLVGTLEIPRGTVRLYGSSFDVRRGRLEFDNPDRIAASVDLTAQTDIVRNSDNNRAQWRVNLHAHGTTEELALDMTSEPSLTREDIFFLLLFRLTRAEVDRVGFSNVSQALAVEALALASGLDRAVREAVPYIDEFRLGSAYNPRTFRTEPQVSIGRQFTDWFRVGASATLSDQPQTRFTSDVRLGQSVSVQGTVDNPTNTQGSQSGNFNTGVDLRWRIEFE